MKRLLLLAALSGALFSCKPKEPEQPSLLTDFSQCTSPENCNETAIQLKDLYQQDPPRVLGDFEQDAAKLRKWIVTLRDAYFFNNQTDIPDDVRESEKLNMIKHAAALKSNAKLKELATILESELTALNITAGSKGQPYSKYVAITGTYGYELPNKGGSGQLAVSLLNHDSMKFQLVLVGPAPAYAEGYIENVAALLSGSVAEFKSSKFSTDCNLRFTFTANGVDIKAFDDAKSACGFAEGISPTHTYQLKNHDDPFLLGSNIRIAKNLQGRWVSTDDAQSEVSFEDGIFTMRYEGNVQERFPYQFYRTAPADMCGTAIDMPCFAVLGQDVVCYTILKVDEKSLELSMIGGTGKTLTFVKK